MGIFLAIIAGYCLGVITPFFKARFLQLVKHFNEYLEKKIKKM